MWPYSSDNVNSEYVKDKQTVTKANVKGLIRKVQETLMFMGRRIRVSHGPRMHRADSLSISTSA